MPAPSAALFDYDESKPAAFKDAGRVNHDYPIKIDDVSYASPAGGRVTAFMAVPPGKGKKPAVIYLHGAGGTRLDLLQPATWMAARGAVTMTIDSPSARGVPAAAEGIEAIRDGRDIEVQTVQDLRRAVDVLSARDDVDPERIGFVGFSAGAKTGAILAGVDHRIKAFALMGGGSFPPSLFAEQLPAQYRKEVLGILRQVDPLRFVRESSPSQMLLQNGSGDEVVPRQALMAVNRAAGKPKTIRWYSTGHEPGRKAYGDQLDWMSARLGLAGPVVTGAKSGP